MKDFYTKKSREEGYYARSAYKLKQLNWRFRLIWRRNKVLDLGCSPGGWVQAALEIVGPQGHVTGVDITHVRHITADNFTFIRADIHEAKIEGKFDAVISDMAPKTTGVKDLDHERSYDLAHTALEIAKEHLRPGGNFICKIFQGARYEEFLQEVKKSFETYKTAKPDASKQRSKEMYVIGKCLKHKTE